VCTGRTTRPTGSADSDYDRAETVEETAELVISGHLAREYGFTDLDGTQPDVWRYIEEVAEADADGRSHP
jgi:hypothetical protein